MANMIRKQIDLSKENLLAINVLAALHDTNAKKYIESLVDRHIKTNAIKIRKLRTIKFR
jgi:hypothetical protein